MLVYLLLIETEENKDKFEYIYNNFKYTMFYEAKNVLRDEHLAEDIVHESFIKIIEIISKIELHNKNRLKRFVILIVRHKAIDLIRKNSKSELIPLDNILDTNEEPKEDILDYIISMQGVEDMMKAIYQLDDIYKIPLELNVLYGYNYKEIGSVLDISDNLVRTRIFRAKKQIKKLISEKHNGNM